MKRRILTILLTFVMTVSLIPILGEFGKAYAFEATGNATFDAFINDSRYTEGVAWTNCYSYVQAFTSYCYGNNNPKAGVAFNNTSEVRAGDVIWINNTHYFAVLKRSGNSLYVAEGNYDGKVKIRWGYTISGNLINNETWTGWHWGSAGPAGPTGSVVDIKTSVYSIHSAINDNLVLDVANGGTAEGTNVQMQTNNGSSAQRFNIVNQGGYYIIIAQCSNLLLDTENNGSTAGANIFTWSNTGANGQHWEFVDAGNGYYYIRTKNGLYLDVKDGSSAAQTNVHAWSYNGSNAQKWKLVHETRTIEEGYYSIHTTKDNNLVLDIDSAGKNNGANLHIWSYNGSRAQIFYIKKEGSNYIITPLCSGLLIDTSGNSGASGANIQQWEDTGATGQRFKFVITGGGNYYIRSNLGMFIDVTDAVFTEGTNIQSCSFNGSTAQKWKLVKEDVSRFKPATPAASVTGNGGNAVISWNNVSSENNGVIYDVRLYNNPTASGDYYKVKWGVDGLSTSFAGLSPGHYSITVAAVDKIDHNLYSGAKRVSFDVYESGLVKINENPSSGGGHNWEVVKTLKEATCEENGSVERRCTVCGATSTFPVARRHASTIYMKHVPAKAATTSAEGNIEYWVCPLCGKYFIEEKKSGAVFPSAKEVSKEYVIIPKLEAPVSGGASAADAEKAIVNAATDEGPAGTVFGLLRLKSTKQTKKSVTLSWSKVNGAAKYMIYANKCGKANKMKRLTIATENRKVITAAGGGNLKKGTYYKFIVVALDKNNNVISTSKVIHVATRGGKVGNDKSVKVSKTVLTKAKKLKTGKTLKLKAKAVKASKLTVKKHRGIAYESSNPKIATVSKKGVVRARAKGTCYVYAYAQDGAYKKVKVVVR